MSGNDRTPVRPHAAFTLSEEEEQELHTHEEQMALSPGSNASHRPQARASAAGSSGRRGGEAGVVIPTCLCHLQAVFNLDLEYSDDDALLDWEQYAGAALACPIGLWGSRSGSGRKRRIPRNALNLRPPLAVGMNRVRCCGMDCSRSPFARCLQPPQWW